MTQKRVVDITLAIIICILLSPLIGGFILVCFPEKEQKPQPAKQRIPAPVKQPLVTKPVTVKVAATKKPFVWNKKLLRTLLISVVIILLVMVFTNPGYVSFKEYTPDRTTKKHYALRKRIHNYLLFSVYEITYFDLDEYGENFVPTSKKYFCFFQNFYEK